MIRPEQIPQSAWLAMRDQMREGIRNEATLIAAALNAWPGMRMMVDIDTGDDAAIKLPLPQETHND